MDGHVDAFFIMFSDEAGDDYVDAQRNTDEQAEQHGNNRAVAADGSHGFFADELTDHGDISGIEKLLHDAGQS